MSIEVTSFGDIHIFCLIEFYFVVVTGLNSCQLRDLTAIIDRVLNKLSNCYIYPLETAVILILLAVDLKYLIAVGSQEFYLCCAVDCRRRRNVSRLRYDYSKVSGSTVYQLSVIDIARIVEVQCNFITCGKIRRTCFNRTAIGELISGTIDRHLRSGFLGDRTRNSFRTYVDSCNFSVTFIDVYDIISFDLVKRIYTIENKCSRIDLLIVIQRELLAQKLLVSFDLRDIAGIHFIICIDFPGADGIDACDRLAGHGNCDRKGIICISCFKFLQRISIRRNVIFNSYNAIRFTRYRTLLIIREFFICIRCDGIGRTVIRFELTVGFIFSC